MKKENETYREQLQSYDANEKDRQIEFLRQMIRASEDALSRERNQAKRKKKKKDNRYKLLLNQVRFFLQSCKFIVHSSLRGSLD